MKKLLTLLMVLIVTVLFTGCSLLPTATPVARPEIEVSPDEFFQYDGLDYSQGEVLVRLKPGVDGEKLFSGEGSQVLQDWEEIGWTMISVPEGKDALEFIKELRRNDQVILAAPNLEYTLDVVPSAIQYDDQWGLHNIHAEAAWDLETGDPNVIIAIIDSGVDINHNEFSGKNFIGAYNATDGTSDVSDNHDHGTHVAGIAADDGRSGQIAGVAWDCPVMPVKIVDVYGGTQSSYLIEAMMYLGAYAETNTQYRIVANMSLGGRNYDFALKDAIDYAALSGVVLVTSAGNDYKRLPRYPAAFNGVVVVAASTPWDQRAEFSTISPWNSVAAPGTRILSTLPDGGYAAWNGTSMASPFVAGAAALLLSQNMSLNPIEVKNQIEQTARGNGFSEELGYGILDLEAVLGPLQPLVYGSLNVATNLTLDNSTEVGVITIFDSSNMLVSYGTTGEYGNHIFHALKPGTYKVNVGYYDEGADNYLVQTQQTTVTTGQTTNLDFEITLPPELIHSFDIEVTDNFSTVESITLSGGEYEFETTYLTQTCDTVLYVADENMNILYQNDDFNGIYSHLQVTLAEGTYFVIIETVSKLPPLNCRLNVYHLP